MTERKVIKDLKIALKDFEPMVKQLTWLQTGGEIQNFKLRPREAWANWLLCAVFQEIHGEDITFAEDADSDGIILRKKTGQQMIMEHVSALEAPFRKDMPTGEARIIEAIDLKIKKGAQYAKGTSLVVFFDGAGSWRRDKVREAINGRHNFDTVFLIGLLSSGEEGYAYSVTQLGEANSISFKVEINHDFTDWNVTPMA